MLVEAELARFSPPKDMILTIGVFDGVHIGHKYLILRLRQVATERNLLSGVVTFKQHPEELFLSATRLPLLTSVEERINLLKDEGVDVIIPLSFTRELSQLGARQFISLLLKHLRMCGLVIGSDFALGKGREGDTDALQKLGQELNFSVTVVPPLVINDETVSSTAIRQALAKGDIRKVREFAGRPFSLQGEVVTGAGRGARLGFPTANLKVGPEYALPPDGVYVGWAHVNGKSYQSMTNIGQCPTFGGCERTVEAYLINYQGNLYGREIKLNIVARLRDEKKFDSIDDLKKQIEEDVKQGEIILTSICEE